MNSDPIDTAVRHVAETREMLEKVVTSSESFNYIEAKKGLQKLQRKMKQLGQLQARLQKMKAQSNSKICVIDFRASKASGQ